MVTTVHDIQEVSRTFAKSDGWNVGIRLWTVVEDLLGRFLLKRLVDRCV
jgi:hypothetical protein